VTPAFDPLAALRALVDHGVRFVVVGGLAARVHGSPTVTNDTDVCYARDRENLERLAAALKDLGARLRGVDEDLPFILDAKTLAAGCNFTFTTSAGSLDVLGLPSGTSGYDDLAAGAERLDLGGGLVVDVVAIEDLIRMKRAAARRKDLVEVEVLLAVKEERDTGRAGGGG
jgi:hypothetical protein